MIWVYAICERAAVTPLPGTGLAGAALEGVDEGELLAVITRHAHVPDIQMDAVVAHEEVVERLMANGPVLPMRFGSNMPTSAALRRALAAHHGELLAALETVRGRVELAVRAVLRNDREHAPAEGDDSGRAYVHRKLDVLGRVEALHAPLAAVAAADSRLPRQTPREVFRASYLVDGAAVADFQSLTRRLQAEHEDLAVLCTGPWPPYSFVKVPILGAG